MSDHAVKTGWQRFLDMPCHQEFLVGAIPVARLRPFTLVAGLEKPGEACTTMQRNAPVQSHGIARRAIHPNRTFPG